MSTTLNAVHRRLYVENLQANEVLGGGIGQHLVKGTLPTQPSKARSHWTRERRRFLLGGWLLFAVAWSSGNLFAQQATSREDLLLTTLDLNGDAILSSDELAKAPTTLRQLDQNADGSLSREEIRRRGGAGNAERNAGGKGGKAGEGSKSRLGNYVTPPAANQVPEHLFNIVLGRPTDQGITIRVVFHRDAQVRVEYGLQAGEYDRQTAKLAAPAKKGIDIVLDKLKANTRYYYRLSYQQAGAKESKSDEYSFHTQRAAGSPFVFTVTSDSHLDENTSGAVYLRTLANALSDAPDFHFELGDTFMTGKYQRPEYSEPQYYAQRYYLGTLCHSSPLFFALGNHDGESGSRGSTTWATQMRKKLFPNPFPDGFYTGNVESEAGVGQPENYYQWRWGDAQFIVLDPFRYTTERSRDGVGNWSWTLGDRQYRWLKSSLESQDVKYRFVFLHHLVGGTVPNSRGGVEAAPFWEWGGKGATGENEFRQRRPGWEAPIHELLVNHGVSIVFHGHDHMFIKQDLDGIVYQLVPQPGHPRDGNTRSAQEYGYLTGETQSSSGHIRVRVSPDSVRADYVRSFLPESEGERRLNGNVTFSYTLK